ncbi:hypothetical protein D3C79_191550 [compost metagenome]
MTAPMYLESKGKLYEVAGYFRYRDGADLFYDQRLTEYMPIHFSQQNKLLRIVDKMQNTCPTYLLDEAILESYSLEPRNCIQVFSKSDPCMCVALIPVSVKASMFDKHEKDPYLFIRKYLEAGHKIHRLRSNVNSMIDFNMAAAGTEMDHRKPLTRETMFRFFKDRPVHQPAAPAKKKSIIRDIRNAHHNVKTNQLLPITLEEDYDDELKAIRKNICRQATKLGGFVEFDYAGTKLSIPKKPFTLWVKRIRKEAINTAWRLMSPSDLKIDGDCLYHSDWWIGAGLPLRAYHLSSNGFLYRPLNEMLSDLAWEIESPKTSKVSLSYLVGGTPSDEMEMRILAESYMNKGLAHHLPITSIIRTLREKGFSVSAA